MTLTNLRIGFDASGPGLERSPGATVGQALDLVRGVGFAIRPGEILALVGESGSGKTLTALAIMGLLPAGGRIRGGKIELSGAGDLVSLNEREMRRIRGRRIAMIFQDAMNALNPVLTIGYQIVEVLEAHRELKGRPAWSEARRLLELVAMPDPERRLRSYPHQMSGGQLQRAMIAMALASQPDVLLADEPTTALDVTIQAQILGLLDDLRQRLGVAILLITHDLAVVAEIADRVVVMFAGEIVEQARVASLFRDPAHPYTRHLLGALTDSVDEAPSLRRDTSGGPESDVPVPRLGGASTGCVYASRCGHVMDRCQRQSPDWSVVSQDGAHQVRCFLSEGPAEEGPSE